MKIYCYCCGFTFASVLLFITIACYYNNNNLWLGTLSVINLVGRDHVMFSQECQNKTTPSGWRQHVKILDNLVYYNRVPKCGSSTFLTITDLLSTHNHFYHAYDYTWFARTLSKKSQRNHKTKLLNLSQTQTPLLYSRHVHFTDFSDSHRRWQPIWINLVRDPADLFVSAFYYERKSLLQAWSKKRFDKKVKELGGKKAAHRWIHATLDDCLSQPDLNCSSDDTVGKSSRRTAIPFFCGHDPRCTILGSDWALMKAKENIEKWYSVIGILEDLDATLKVLEAALPSFFRDATKFYNYVKGPAPKVDRSNMIKVRLKRGAVINKNDMNVGISDVNRVALKRKLSKEYDLYDFVKQRLYAQHRTCFMQ